jgi:glycerol-3-phosphate acyltransferase PlsX
MLKTVQGAAQVLFSWIKDETEKASWWEQGMVLGATPLLKRIKAKTDYASTGGALLLGVNHPIILAHGRSDGRAIANAIRFAYQVAEKKYVSRFNEELASLIGKQVSFAGAVTQKMRSIFHWGQP